MIRTSICIQATHRGSVVRGLVLGDAHPRGNLLHGQLVLIVQLLRQLTATVDLCPARGWIAHWLCLLHMLHLCHILWLMVLRLLERAGPMMVPCQPTTSHIGCCILATIRSIRLPRREAIPGNALSLCVDLAHTQHIVGNIVIPQTSTAKPTASALTWGRAPVDIANLKDAMGATSRSATSAKGSRVQVTRVLGDAHQRGHLGRWQSITMLQLGSQLAALEHAAWDKLELELQLEEAQS